MQQRRAAFVATLEAEQLGRLKPGRWKDAPAVRQAAGAFLYLGQRWQQHVVDHAEDVCFDDQAEGGVAEWDFLSMLTIPPFPTTENDRYADAHPTGLHEYLAGAHHALRHS